MLALQTDVHAENDLFAAERFVYAIDHAGNSAVRAKQAADLMRNWDGRMLAASAAPTIAVRASQELTRLLLEPRLGAAPKDPNLQETTLSWETYHWQMRTTWLQNILLRQPKGWLPGKDTDYNALISAAGEAAANAPAAPQHLAHRRRGQVDAVEVAPAVVEKSPF